MHEDELGTRIDAAPARDTSASSIPAASAVAARTIPRRLRRSLSLRFRPMSESTPRTIPLVLVPVFLTLALTILRLVGELNGWNPTLFGKPEAGGDKALLGISWLIFVFGLWFGFRLQRGGAGPQSKKQALFVSLLAVGVLVGGMFGLMASGLMSIPDEQNPGEPRGMGYMTALVAAASVVSFLAWGRAALVLLLYGIFARIPVVIVTVLALGKEDWNTHYTKIPTFFTNVQEADKATFLLMPQLMFWPGLTIVMGTAMACLGAMLTRDRSQA